MDFKADNLFADYDENDILIIAFSGKAEKEDTYLMIQNVHDRNSEQEIELGINTYYIEINDQTRAGYGGIDEVELWKNLISIKLNSNGKKNLGIEKGIINIRLRLNDKEFENLTEKLKATFIHESNTKTTYNKTYN